MLEPKMKFSVLEIYEKFLTDTSESTEVTILKTSVRCPIYVTLFQLDN
jgi:hypothetical protein